MGTSLTGLTPATTYDALIKVGDNGPISGTAKILSDGLGNDSVLALSTTSVGIGTTSGTSKANILSATVAQTVLTLEGNYAGSGSVELLEFNRNGGAVSGAIKYQDADTAMSIGTTTSHAFLFNTADTERMRITSAGNVGIGTSVPPFKLSVSASDTSNSYPTNASIHVINYEASNFGRTMGVNFAVGAGGLTEIIGGVYGVYTGYTTSTGGALSFVTNNGSGTLAEKARITSDGYLRLASGTGGIQFNGDTAAANALDDYEEGTFTPTAIGATTTGTTTYTAQNGYYTKIGRQVTVNLFVAYSSLTGTGDIRIGGLPFAIANFTENYPIGSCVVSALDWTNGTYLQAIAFPNESNIYIAYIGDDVSANLQQCVDEAATFRITMTYFV